MTKQTELKPCPFCGNSPYCYGDLINGFYIECDRCEAKVGYFGQDMYGDINGDFESSEKAITAWNTRA